MLIPEFVAKWSHSAAAERANKDAFLIDLCDALGVDRPNPTTGDAALDTYVFEKDVFITSEEGAKSIGKIDLFKHRHFLLEAKQGSERTSLKLGTARRGTASWNIAMHDAFGQALGYARMLSTPPPFLVICDIGYCFDLYAQFDGSGNYRKYPDALSSRIYFRDFEKHADTFRRIFTDPDSLDLTKKSARVTREIATHIASLARDLEAKHHSPELVAKFLMRCLFTMFAEDVELLRRGVFTDAVRDRWIDNPKLFKAEVESLWKAMNEGGSIFGVGKILQFNGGLFADPVALHLTKDQLAILGMAAACDWKDVEPAIFGTLLERAFDPKERHRLGAHYTPRAYVERLVKPTIEEPLRDEWDLVRAEVRQIMSASKTDDDPKAMTAARKPVYAFYDKLTQTRVLDPACGSGNFLYVTLDLFKRIENEILALLHDLGDTAIFNMHGRSVTPEQFLGIEIKPWAKEITELVLWIGYLQWQIRNRGWMSHVPEPVLRDYHNIECRDAVLAYDRVEPLVDDDGKPVTRWDGETMKKHPVTGEDVPDETAQVPVMRFVNPRKAEWPKADYIVGNPPYLGARVIRPALGDSYVDALRNAYAELPDTVDIVMYWWHRSATRVESGESARFGLITTNSIVQDYSRPVLESHLEKMKIVFTVPDHPWPSGDDSARVAVAMTVGTALSDRCTPIIGKVTNDDSAEVTVQLRSVERISASLSATNEDSLLSLLANVGLCFQGVVPAGEGFKLTLDDLTALGISQDVLPPVVKKYIIGKDLVQQPTKKFIIDFFGSEEHSAIQKWPALYQRLRDRVFPERATNNRKQYRDRWWMFAEARPALRVALSGLSRFIGTPYTAKFRPFVFLASDVIPDAMVYAIALDDPFFLGVLSSRAHAFFSFATGGSLEDRPRYNSNRTFVPFPFPNPNNSLKQRIRELGEQLDAHRKRQQELHPDLTITGMYNVLEKLRSGEALTPKEKAIHEKGLVSVLRQIHDDLDAAVFEAYGWPKDLTDEQILERLVQLNAERAEEERRGIVRWLRPEFQNPDYARQPAQGEIAIPQPQASTDEEGRPLPRHRAPLSKEKTERRSWPKSLPEQITAVRQLATHKVTVDAHAIASEFKSARTAEVEEVLASLAALGLLVSVNDTPRQWRAV